VSVAFGKDHLYVLGTTTVESHRIGGDGIESSADGSVALLAADASAAQVGIVGDQLVVTEKSGTIELVPLRAGAVDGTPVSVTLPASSRDTPFGLVTRGSNAYVTIAGSRRRLIERPADCARGDRDSGRTRTARSVLDRRRRTVLFTASTHRATAFRDWSPAVRASFSTFRWRTHGRCTDRYRADGDRLAVVESNGGGVSHLTQFTIDEDGNLTHTVSSAIAGSANGVAFISEK
jgi:hypothetical protein